ncbi:MAG: MCE family protein [Nocardioides sp.]|nr:MCE family protein [Nocardioides sp.]
MKRHLRLSLILVIALLLSACEFSVDKLPLPGGADVGEDPVKVTVTCPDVLDLVPQSTVKVADVTVGKVTDIELKDNEAEVTLAIRQDADLPANTLAEIRQTSLLGEKFVSLRAPEDPHGTLSDGDNIGLESTNRNPEVEEVLGALSLVLNGGGVAQLKTITSELNNALEGREGSAKSVLTQLSSFMEQLDDNKTGIVNAIRKLNQLSVSANKQRKTITTALDDLPGALDSIDSQRADLVKMLKALSRLGNVGTRVISASKTATIDTLTQLQPVLTQFAKSGDDFANAFHVFLTYPFVDESVGRDPQVARNLHMGDFVNLSIKLDVRLLAPGEEETACIPLGMIPPGGGIDLSDLCKKALKKVSNCLDTADLRECLKALDPVLELPCKILPQLCKNGRKGDEDGKGDKGPLLPGLPDLGLGLDEGLDDLLNGRGRAAPGAGGGGQTSVSLGRMMEDYDPALVAGLLPGVAR